MRQYKTIIHGNFKMKITQDSAYTLVRKLIDSHNWDHESREKLIKVLEILADIEPKIRRANASQQEPQNQDPNDPYSNDDLLDQ